MKRPNRKTLKFYARMAAESYVNDPVHCFATKSPKWRKKFVYHFMMCRFACSVRSDYFYFDEEKRGLCIMRDAHNEYSFLGFLTSPNWPFLMLYCKSLIKTLMAYGHLDSEVFEKGTYIISPVFVDKAHQGKGVASKLIRRAINDLVPKGYKIGLETQNPNNVPIYEKLGFETIKYDYYKLEKIHNYYMVYNPDKK